jgi:hypothetical protein
MSTLLRWIQHQVSWCIARHVICDMALSNAGARVGVM